MLDLKAHFTRFLESDPERLHFAAHSHHPWPDVTRDAQVRAWDDASRLMDEKWGLVLGPVLSEARRHIADILRLPDPGTIAIAPNTHDFFCRILSCMPSGRPARILSTTGEFHSFVRQAARLSEESLVVVDRVSVEPFETFEERFTAAARAGYDLVWLSQVFFDSGFAVTGLEDIAAECGDAYLVVDGYHGFMARPTSLAATADRAFYLAGGYKYAMSGEGICFMHCPPGWGSRPRDTGWFAAFDALEESPSGQVSYLTDGRRFMGATFDPSSLYRFNAVMRWLDGLALSVAAVHEHAKALQQLFVEELSEAGPLPASALVVPLEVEARGNFLTFEYDEAQSINRRLREVGVITDVRGRRIRVGFGVYQTAQDIERLHHRLARLA